MFANTLDILFFGPYKRISDVQQGVFSELADNLTLKIGVFLQYVPIADD
jgi:hypothetical protein